MKNFILKFITLLKGRSVKQIQKSELDRFIDSFEKKREQKILSREEERKKSKLIAEQRDKLAPESEKL